MMNWTHATLSCSVVKRLKFVLQDMDPLAERAIQLMNRVSAILIALKNSRSIGRWMGIIRRTVPVNAEQTLRWVYIWRCLQSPAIRIRGRSEGLVEIGGSYTGMYDGGYGYPLTLTCSAPSWWLVRVTNDW